MGAHQSRACLGALLGTLIAHGGMAQTMPPGSLVWDCAQRYDEQYSVRCAPRQSGGDLDAMEWSRQTIATQSARQYRSQDVRPVAHRGGAEVFAVAAWDVPLYALPLDEAFVVELLRSVLCGRVPGCEIRYHAPEVRSVSQGRSGIARRALP